MDTKYCIKYYLLLILCYSASLSSCQTKKTLATDTVASSINNYLIQGDYKILEVDKLGYTYLVNSANEIIKLKGKEILFRFSSKRLGNVTQLDVTNPQKILVYFGDYYQILFLDNTLSEIMKLDLEGMGYWDVQSVALSRDNFIWIYDPVNVKLLKINQNGESVLSSNELYAYGFEDFSPRIKVGDQVVYLYDDTEVKVFDEYGTWLKKYAIENKGIQVTDEEIIFMGAGKLKAYSTAVAFKEPVTGITPLSEGVRDFYLAPDFLHLIDGQGYYRKDIQN